MPLGSSKAPPRSGLQDVRKPIVQCARKERCHVREGEGDGECGENGEDRKTDTEAGRETDGETRHRREINM